MDVGNVLKTLGRKAAFKLKLHKAEILTGVGLTGMVTGTALAIKKTRTVEPILEAYTVEKKSIEVVDSRSENIKLKMKTGYNLVKHYAPAIGAEIIGAGCIIGGHRTLTVRNTSLTAAYAALNTAYTAYQNKVAALLTDEQKAELYGLELTPYTDVVVNEDGTKTKTKMQLFSLPEDTSFSYPGLYSIIYGPGCPGWEHDPTICGLYIKYREQWFHEKLVRDGFVWYSDFLDEFVNMHELEQTDPAKADALKKAGRVMGWRIHEDGDNYVTFRAEEFKTPKYDNKGKAIGWELYYVLDPNVEYMYGMI